MASFCCCLQAEVQHLIPQVKSARTKEAGEYCGSFFAHQAWAEHKLQQTTCVSAGLTAKNAELHEQLGALMDEVQYKDAVNNVLAQDIVRLQQQQQSGQVCSHSQPAWLQQLTAPEMPPAECRLACSLCQGAPSDGLVQASPSIWSLQSCHEVPTQQMQIQTE